MANRQRTRRGLGRQFQSEYRSWACMFQRCTNKSHEAYPRYGGAGITICDEWMSFAHFIWDMGPKPGPKWTIERKDNKLGYCLSNCRWGTRREQVENRGNARMVVVSGERMTMGRAAREAGIHKATVATRVDCGCSLTAALTKTVASQRLLTHDGKTMPLAEWAREKAIPETTILSRIDKLGWPVDRALTTPARTGKPRDRQTRRRATQAFSEPAVS